MKTLLLLVLSCIVCITHAQESDRMIHCIFFQKPGNDHLRKISEGDHCIIGVLQKIKQYEGEIKRISLDTVYIVDTSIKVRDIAYFCFRNELKSPFLLSKPADLPREYILFGKDTLVWNAIIPPTSIYSSVWDYRMYVKDLESSAKYGERHKPPRNPFQKNKFPGRK
jgi:hypothetical protein